MLRRLGDGRGGAATIVLFPLFAIVTFMFTQAIMWQHDRQIMSAAADRASTAVALYGASSGDAQAQLVDRLAEAGIGDVSVSISRGTNETVVEISGDAPGILVGTSSRIAARSVTPTDSFDAP